MATTSPVAPNGSSERPPSLKERQRLEREALILQATDELLAERGYHDTSIDDIAARVGISKGTVYLHFASKEDLVFALIERGMRGVVAMLDATLAAPGTPREKLRATIEQIYAASMSQQRFQLMGALARDPEFQRRLMDKRQELGELWKDPRQRIAAVLEEGKAAGEFDPDMPTPIMLSLFLGALSPQHSRLLIVEEGMPMEVVVAHLIRYFLKGIAPGEPPPAAHVRERTHHTSEPSATHQRTE